MKYKGTHLRLPLIGLAQARLLLALLRQASYWPYSGRPLIGFVKPIGRYWNISGQARSGLQTPLGNYTTYWI